MKKLIKFLIASSVLAILGYIFYKKNDVTGIVNDDVEYVTPESVDFDIDVPITGEEEE